MQCRKVAVLAVVTECGECNKQALLEIDALKQHNAAGASSPDTTS